MAGYSTPIRYCILLRERAISNRVSPIKDNRLKRWLHRHPVPRHHGICAPETDARPRAESIVPSGRNYLRHHFPALRTGLLSNVPPGRAKADRPALSGLKNQTRREQKQRSRTKYNRRRTASSVRSQANVIGAATQAVRQQSWPPSQ